MIKIDDKLLTLIVGHVFRAYFGYYVPVSVKVVAGFVSQRGAKVEAALVDEKLDELSKRKRKEKKKKRRDIALPEEYNASMKKEARFLYGGIQSDLWTETRTETESCRNQGCAIVFRPTCVSFR